MEEDYEEEEDEEEDEDYKEEEDDKEVVQYKLYANPICIADARSLYLELLCCLDHLPLAKDGFQENLISLACLKLNLFHFADVTDICSDNPPRLPSQHVDPPQPVGFQFNYMRDHLQIILARVKRFCWKTRLWPPVEIGSRESDLDPEAKLLCARLEECTTYKRPVPRYSVPSHHSAPSAAIMARWTPLNRQYFAVFLDIFDESWRKAMMVMQRWEGTRIPRSWRARVLSETLHSLLRGAGPTHPLFQLLRENSQRTYGRLADRLEDMLVDWEYGPILRAEEGSGERNAEDTDMSAADTIEGLTLN